MKGLRVDAYTIEDVLYGDVGVAVARGLEPGGKEALLLFLSARKDDDDNRAAQRPHSADRSPKVPSIHENFEFSYLPMGSESACKGVLPLLGYGKSRNWTVLAYRYVRALPLFVHIKRGDDVRRLEALQYVLQLCETVDRLHEVGLISTEINLSNIFIDEQEQLYLGYNQALAATDYRNLIRENPQVQRYSVVAPEQIWGNGPSRSTDIFQLGVFLTSVLTRRLLTLTDKIAKMDFKAALNGLYPPVDFTHGLPKVVDQVVERAVQPEPPDRYSSLSEFRAALEGALSKVRITDAVSEAIREGTVRKRPTAPRVDKEKERKKREKANTRQALRDKLNVTSNKGAAGTGFLERLNERLGPYGVPIGIAVIGVCLVVIPLVGFSFNETVVAPQPVPTGSSGIQPRSTVSPNATRNSARPTPRFTKKPVSTVIEFTELTPKLNQTRARPTDETSYRDRKRFLQQCYLKLPREHRGKAISSSVFQQLFQKARKNPKTAYRLMDETFEKFESYLREHGAKM